MIFIRIGFEISMECRAPTPLLLALLPHSSLDRRVIGCDGIHADPAVPLEGFIDGYGNRRTRFVAPAGGISLWSDCVVEDPGTADPFDWHARQHEVEALPSATLQYLMASRYCESDLLAEQAWSLFGDTPRGWARVQAISDWVHNHLTFGYHYGRSSKTAVDALREQTGVCRDFAHLMVAFCRAMNIPARYASGYLGDIDSPDSGAGDLAAWAEVFVGGRWYAFDARHNTPRIGRVLMVRGRDAADVAMITSFGRCDLKTFRIWTHQVTGIASDDGLMAHLQTRPSGSALTLATR